MMAKKNQAPPAPLPSSAPKGGGIWHTLKKIIWVLGGLGLLFLALDQMGIEPVQRTESLKIDHHPAPKHTDWEDFKERKQNRKAEKAKYDEKAETRLKEFIEDYRSTGNRDLKGADLEFLRKMDEKAQGSKTLGSAKGYYNFMRNTYRFYDAVQNLGGMESKSSSTTPHPANGLLNRMMSANPDSLGKFTQGNPSNEQWMRFLEK